MQIIYNGHRAKVLHGLNEERLELVRNALAYEPPEAKHSPLKKKFLRVKGKPVYNPKFVKEDLDLRVHLFSKRTHEFPTGLMGTVLGLFEGVEVRPELPVKTLKQTMQIDCLYPYQRESVEALAPVKRGMIEVPTGGGKTYITAELVLRARGMTILVTVPSVDLLHQTRDELTRITGQYIGIYGDSEKDPAPITVATIQSITNDVGWDKKTKGLKYDLTDVGIRERIEWLQTIDYWLVDECHGAATESFLAASSMMPRANIRHGLTATMRREDGADLVMIGVLGPCRLKIHPMELVEQGFLTRPRVELHIFDHPTYRKGRGKLPYPTLYKQAVVDNDRRTSYIRKVVKEKLAEGRGPIAVLFEKLEHGRILYNALRDLGRTVYLDGDTETKSRRKVKQQVEDGDIDVVVASIVWVTGVNIKRLQTLIVAGPDRSGIRTVQRAGRVLRIFAGKDEALIIDICDHEESYLKSQYYDRRYFYNEKYPGCVHEITVD